MQPRLGTPQTLQARGQWWVLEAGGDQSWHQSPGTACSLPRMCVSSCPAGFFGDNGARRCRRCHKGCERCVGRGPSQCTACKRNLYHHPEMGTCVLLCPAGFYAEERKDCLSLASCSMRMCRGCFYFKCHGWRTHLDP